MFSLTHNIALNKSPSSLFITASAATSSQSSAAQLQVCKEGQQMKDLLTSGSVQNFRVPVGN
jgi:hypothetical protein